VLTVAELLLVTMEDALCAPPDTFERVFGRLDNLLPGHAHKSKILNTLVCERPGYWPELYRLIAEACWVRLPHSSRHVSAFTYLER